LSPDGIAEVQAALLALCDLTPEQWTQEATQHPFTLKTSTAAEVLLARPGTIGPPTFSIWEEDLPKRLTLVDDVDRLPPPLLRRTSARPYSGSGRR
jgi:hypothetical protein